MADPSVDKDKVFLVGAGKPVGKPFVLFGPAMTKITKITLPPGVLTEDVTVTSRYSDEDEEMRMVREVNEDPPDELVVRVDRKLSVSLDRIVVDIKLEID